MKKRGLKIVIIIVAVIIFINVLIGTSNAICYKSLMKYAKTFDKVEYTNQLKPTLEGLDYTFYTDSELKILQITDVHLGSGFLSYKKDKMTLNAISSMITYEKPDLVIFTGDIAFPVPYVSGTFNDKTQVNILNTLMNKLGVYYTVILGNHDSESYSYFNREQVNKFYLNGGDYCLYLDNYPELTGCGNQIINVKNSSGVITRTLFLVDSNSYLPSDPLGYKWEYDNVGEDVIKWYSDKVKELHSYNQNILGTNSNDYSELKSFIFMHIPLNEYKDAYDEYRNNNFNDTENVKYIDGVVGELDPYSYGPKNPDDFFETILELNSTEAIFCGHDHLNNITLNYKGIDLVYGMSIDYLAYSNISKFGSQRGCTVININNDIYTISKENYYQDKYVSKYEKEEVSFENYYGKE